MSQRLMQIVQATSDSDGNATFAVSQCPPSDLVWTGTVSVPLAPSRASFQAYLGTNSSGANGIPIGGWGGPSPFGPVQALGGEFLSIVATGLTPTTTYTAIWLGSSDSAGTVPFVFPSAVTPPSNLAISSTPVSTLYGSGQDGAATLDGVVTPAWATRVGSVYTMTRDAKLTTLVVNNGVTLKTAGWRVQANVGITNNGTIHNDGGNGGNGGTGAAGGGTAGPAGAAGSMNGGAAGGAGGQGGTGGCGGGGGGGGGVVSLASPAIVNNGAIHANGGAGGNGNATQPTTSNNGSAGTAPSSPSLGGAGGKGGGPSGANPGGNGGAIPAGGPFFIGFPQGQIGNTVAMSGGGGGGGGSINASGTGGGGGGGGGVVAIVTSSLTGSGTVTASGGAGGALGFGGAGTGANGQDGNVLEVQVSQ